jgi:hypothetical protein
VIILVAPSAKSENAPTANNSICPGTSYAETFAELFNDAHFELSNHFTDNVLVKHLFHPFSGMRHFTRTLSVKWLDTSKWASLKSSAKVSAYEVDLPGVELFAVGAFHELAEGAARIIKARSPCARCPSALCWAPQ